MLFQLFFKYTQLQLKKYAHVLRFVSNTKENIASKFKK